MAAVYKASELRELGDEEIVDQVREAQGGAVQPPFQRRPRKLSRIITGRQGGQ